MILILITEEERGKVMNLNIVAVCNSEKCAEKLLSAGKELCYIINCEIQINNSIKRKLSNENIENANAVLFVTDKSVEEIEEIERFIDREYYEVEPKFVIDNPKNVLNEIASDLN
ncbi:MAG: PTS sugar transporter subunit IIBC [Peptostreptococcaceae bacterium]